MIRSVVELGFFLLGIVASLVVTNAWAEAPQLYPLQTEEGQERLDWVFSAVPAPSGGVYLLEVTKGIWHYSEDGQLVDEVLPPAQVAHDYRPRKLQRVGNVYVLEYNTGKFIVLDKSFQPTGDHSILDLKVDWPRNQETGSKLASAWQWTYTPDHSLIVLGDVQHPDGKWETRFVRVPFAAPYQFSLIGDTVSDNLRELYLFSNNFLVTALDGEVFAILEEGSHKERENKANALRKHEEPRAVLGRLRSPAREVGFEIVEDVPLPTLPVVDSKDFSTIEEMFGYLDQHLALKGLVGSPNLLGVLRYKSGRDASWTLVTLQPEATSGELVKTDEQKIPVKAQQVLVVAVEGQTSGSLRVSLVAKGPVESFGKQEILGLQEVTLTEGIPPRRQQRSEDP